MPRFVGLNLAHNLLLVDVYEALAAEAGMTPAQLSLAWVLSRGPHVIAIPGTRSISHLEEDVAALTFAAPTDLLAAVDTLFAPGALHGPRYTAAMQAQIDTETLPGEELA